MRHVKPCKTLRVVFDFVVLIFFVIVVVYFFFPMTGEELLIEGMHIKQWGLLGFWAGP